MYYFVLKNLNIIVNLLEKIPKFNIGEARHPLLAAYC